MKNSSKIVAVLALAGMAGLASAQLTLREIERVDVSAAFSGAAEQTSAVAWDGTNLAVASFNNGSSTDTRIALFNKSGGSWAQSGSAFGVLTTPGARGYSGLDLQNGTLVAAWDNGGASATGLQAFNLAGNQLWTANIRGGGGVAFDPGFGGADAGVAAINVFNSGRRQLWNSSTGANIYDGANGMIVNGANTGSFFRSIDFDNDTGNVWLREGNNVIRGDRSGGNSLSSTNLIVDAVEADFVAGQNIAYMNNSFAGDLVIYNDRSVVSSGQSAASVLRIIDNGGAAVSFDLALIGGGTIADLAAGNGWYDFSYDEATKTLAMVDFISKQVHIFAVPAPSAAGLLGIAGLMAARRRR
jgi:hypothetical protein